MDGIAKARSLVARCAAIDWRRPQHDPARVAAAYARWFATLGLSRRVRWVADPADVAAWQTRNEGIAGVWAIMAANATGASTIAPLLDAALKPATPRWQPPSAGAEIPAAWAFAISSHITAAQAAWDTWAAAWAEMSARKPDMAATLGLLCPGVPWPAPPMMVRAAIDALSACADGTIWPVLADILAAWQMGAAAQLPPGYKAPTQAKMIETLIAVAEPMIDACEAGAFAHIVLKEEIIVLAAPAIASDGRRLHRADGPALAWPRTEVYAWKGVLVPRGAIVEPRMITPEVIRAVTDEPLRHTLIDIYAHVLGHRRTMQDLGGVIMHEDHTGRLWWLNPATSNWWK